MSEQVPAPGFDSQNYARPNQGWICGNAAAGKPCPLGPDRRGGCQATTECVPLLETLPGETKGRWRCNRSGEKCESGPLPDGRCCRPIQRCAPVPTLRTIRRRVNLVVITTTCAALLILFGISQARRAFINPGPLSIAHSSLRLAHPVGVKGDQTCIACHASGSSGPEGILTAGLQAEPQPWNLAQLISAKPGAPTAMDDACLKCHVAHDFHQSNTHREVGCAFCHHEHQGPGGLAATTDAHCALCHGDAALMAAAVSKVARTNLSDSASSRPLHPGGTQVIHGFSTDHPEFRMVSSHERDPDTLRFNHQLHLNSSTIPALANGRKLDCAFCHQPDASGMLMRPMRFENQCQVCHSLQFDPETPDLTLPHGSVEAVSAFLHSLPRQYDALAQREGISSSQDRKKFVEEKLSRLRAQSPPGEDFERQIFFSTSITGPSARAGVVEGATRALFPGCAYCHEVISPGTAGVATGGPNRFQQSWRDAGGPRETAKSGPGLAEVTKPILTERWFAGSHFEHNKHSSIACVKCHAAEQSSQTSDVLMPAKATCVECHSPAGGAANSCVTCHTYHNSPPRHAQGVAMLLR